MKILLSIEYTTQWGENVAAIFTLHRTAGKDLTERFDLDTKDGTTWYGEAHIAQRDITSFSYQYVISRGDKVIRREWNIVPRNLMAAKGMTFHCADYWRDAPQLSYMYSSAYLHAHGLSPQGEVATTYFDQTILFRVQAPQLQAGEALALVGSQPPIGAWNQHMALRMQRAGLHEWVLAISAQGMYLPFEYKYVVVDEQTGELLRWEEGENRLSSSHAVEQGHTLVISDMEIHDPAPRWKTAGVVIPVFSLRSTQSQGIGDFGDLKRMADWAHQSGLHMIQLLPIYDTTQTHTFSDSYPYSSISIYALHPLYLDLNQLPAIQDEAYMQAFRERCATLNALPQLDYEGVERLKHDYLHRLYEQEGEVVLMSEDFNRFAKENEDWLTAYCVFCMLREEYGTCHFLEWPEHSVYQAEEVARLAQRESKQVGYYAFLQFLLDGQLSQTIAYARSKGILFKGDIPIGISRYSVEAWAEADYFHMNGQAGAPPDDFSADGQNWGFPTYNWTRMAEDGYQWWVRRMTKMARYFDAYRIDHVLGFFRIWQIPLHSVHGLLGHFAPAMPLTADEITEAGIPFQLDRMTKPYITDQVLKDIFGEIEYLARPFIQETTPGRYEMLPAFATQRQVEKAFEGREDAMSTQLRDGLYRLISNVLFVPDMDDNTRFHPRIAVMGESTFSALTMRQQEAFRALYEDYFYHRHDYFWYQQAMQKLPTLAQCTTMLTCAEDLGMVPACVPSVLQQLHILSLEIQSMPKTIGVPFAHIEDNPQESVCTIFTHDMPTLRQWWEEDTVRSQHYYNQILQHDGFAPEVMPGWLCEEIVARHLFCPSMLALISLQDWLSIDERLRLADAQAERINIPANPRHYWRYRMHLTLEDLMAQTDFSSRIQQMVTRAGR